MDNDHQSVRYGFIGLGNMGQPMASHVLRACQRLTVFDLAGTRERAPDGALLAESTEAVVAGSDVIALSLPSAKANREVIEQISRSAQPGTVIVDTCTIGSPAAVKNAEVLRAAGIEYVDSPISGLKFRAEEGSLASMMAGNDAACERAQPLIDSYSRTVFRVGDTAGQGQRMKVVNNALYISSLVTTAEALAYGQKGGLDMAKIFEVVNASSGMNFTTSQVFPKFLIEQAGVASGAEAHILRKDLELFVQGSSEENTSGAVIAEAFAAIEAFAQADPLQDMMEIVSFVRDRKT